MNDNFEKNDRDERFVTDDMNNGQKETFEGDKNDKDSSQGGQEMRQISEEEREDNAEKEEAARQESENGEEKLQKVDEGLSGRSYAAHYICSPTPTETKKNKKRFSGGFVVAVAAVCVVLSLLFGAGAALAVNYYLRDSGEQQSEDVISDIEPEKDNVVTITKNNSPAKLKENIENTEKETMTLVEVVEKVAASVVEVSTLTSSNYGQYVSSGAGSGVIIAQGAGYAYIVTNYHVVDGSDSITVRLTDKREYEAVYLDGDEYDDIAVIRIEETEELCVATIGSSDTLRVGEGVVAIGNPLGELGGTVTDGIVSALDREITIDGITMTLLQTNAAVNPGNSGGGLFNMAGELIAVVNAKHRESGIEGLGFAIPIDHVYGSIFEIIEDGYIHGRVTIGIEAIYLDRMSASYYFRSNKDGVYIISTSEESEFSVGDRITFINDKEITSDAEYNTAVSELEIGSSVTIRVVRGGSYYDITVTVEEYIPEGIVVKN